jgi:hypothetical protein
MDVPVYVERACDIGLQASIAVPKWKANILELMDLKMDIGIILATLKTV